MKKANSARDALHQPQRRDKEIYGTLKERRTIAFDGMSHKLQDPTSHEERERPTPPEEKQRQRDRDHGNPDRVT